VDKQVRWCVWDGYLAASFYTSTVKVLKSSFKNADPSCTLTSPRSQSNQQSNWLLFSLRNL
jgi:hypothetical protein